jgi:hypothetical protein
MRDMAIPPGYIDEIVAAKRKTGVDLAKDGVYEGRLESCRACDMCVGGIMCSMCGCFIQFRALGRDAYCPHPSGDNWKAGASPDQPGGEA